mmetsp:Transcript_69625/g.123242  ORF Transcript_69625/g.123242 Transcript_69625/m.123242 type:complete len:1255 (-) Transcript_69625:124-3888(-)
MQSDMQRFPPTRGIGEVTGTSRVVSSMPAGQRPGSFGSSAAGMQSRSVVVPREAVMSAVEARTTPAMVYKDIARSQSDLTSLAEGSFASPAGVKQRRELRPSNGARSPSGRALTLQEKMILQRRIQASARVTTTGTGPAAKMGAGPAAGVETARAMDSAEQRTGSPLMPRRSTRNSTGGDGKGTEPAQGASAATPSSSSQARSLTIPNNVEDKFDGWVPQIALQVPLGLATAEGTESSAEAKSARERRHSALSARLQEVMSAAEIALTSRAVATASSPAQTMQEQKTGGASTSARPVPSDSRKPSNSDTKATVPSVMEGISTADNLRKSDRRELEQQAPKSRSRTTSDVSIAGSAKAGSAGSAKAPIDEKVANLKEGVIVKIENMRFQISGALGTGSYGVVWSARQLENTTEGDEGGRADVAIKEIHCRSEAELSNALFEGGLLLQLAGGWSSNGNPSSPSPSSVASASLSLRIPSMVAQEADCVAAKEWRVRLAMSRIAGEPLVLLLQHRHLVLKSQEPENSAAELLRLLQEPCRIASELLVQLGPALNDLSKIAYHRDVNPRNILVDGASRGSKGPTSFGLVDFGMAVDAHRWHGTAQEEGTWRYLEVGGDCRYWPLSSWVMFMRGPQELAPGSALRTEYLTALDRHALGITALQVFMELVPPVPPTASGSIEICRVLGAVQCIQDAWKHYWEDVSYFWHGLIECFQTNGDWTSLKTRCIEKGLDTTIAGRIVDMKLALSEAGSACMALKQGVQGREELEVLLRTLHAMLSDAGAPLAEKRPRKESQDEMYLLKALSPQHDDQKQQLEHKPRQQHDKQQQQQQQKDQEQQQKPQPLKQHQLLVQQLKQKQQLREQQQQELQKQKEPEDKPWNVPQKPDEQHQDLQELQQRRKQLQQQQQPPQQSPKQPQQQPPLQQTPQQLQLQKQEEEEQQGKVRRQLEEDLRREFFSISSTRREIQEDTGRSFQFREADVARPGWVGRQFSTEPGRPEIPDVTVVTSKAGQTSSRSGSEQPRRLIRQVSQPVSTRAPQILLSQRAHQRMADETEAARSPRVSFQDYHAGESPTSIQLQSPSESYSPDARARSVSPVQRKSTSVVARPGLGLAGGSAALSQPFMPPHNMLFSGGQGGSMLQNQSDFHLSQVGTPVMPPPAAFLQGAVSSGRSVAAVPGTPPVMPPSTPLVLAGRSTRPDAQAAAMAAMAEAAKRVQMARAAQSGQLRAAQVAQEARAARAPDASWPEPVHSVRMKPGTATS